MNQKIGKGVEIAKWNVSQRYDDKKHKKRVVRYKVDLTTYLRSFVYDEGCQVVTFICRAAVQCSSYMKEM